MHKLINQQEIDDWKAAQPLTVRAIMGIDLAYRLQQISAESAMDEINRLIYADKPAPHIQLDPECVSGFVSQIQDDMQESIIKHIKS